MFNSYHVLNFQSMQSHKADVYCLAVDDTETTVVCSGIDSAIVQFNFIAARENSDWKDWVGSFMHNQHTHDVRAIEIIDNTVVTGGNIHLFRTQKFGNIYEQSLFYIFIFSHKSPAYCKIKLPA